MVVRCRKKHKGKENSVHTRRKRTHPACTMHCTACVFPSEQKWKQNGTINQDVNFQQEQLLGTDMTLFPLQPTHQHDMSHSTKLDTTHSMTGETAQ